MRKKKKKTGRRARMHGLKMTKPGAKGNPRQQSVKQGSGTIRPTNEFSLEGPGRQNKCSKRRPGAGPECTFSNDRVEGTKTNRPGSRPANSWLLAGQ